ncbi:G-protein coupled bile acid receptor 1 [Sceloporus undulatus]|uniref:G-protein coupled bile acid receptor 1 n=1 Tax=Sceloporus undulatus TaxID=8520 RepID=UPI001C4D2AEA|nr:G-protein coupled bile acid receptor 1 [Sceloporus undulatus]XP_042301473.1 G-protein coupled bile acid receptor 1 [Sceloporus undulatus]XP_042301474.1 G-protein coupled bile acid receptor 1 [Sceloporus undulatus]
MEESSSKAQTKNKTQELIIIWLAQPLSAFIILTNVFIILGILFNRKLHGATNWFFVSLLFADLLAGAALPCIPQMSFEMELEYHSCFLKYVVPNFLFLSFLANLLLVHYVKYVCIIHPLHYQSSWVHRWAALYIVLAWAAPLIFAALPLAWNQWKPNVNCSFDLVFPMTYLYLETYGFLIPAILAMAFMCVQVLCVAQRHLKNITKLLHSVNQSQAPSELEQQLELRNAKSIISASLIFLVCWVPYIACLNISLLASKHNISPLVLTVVSCIGTGSAAAVPIILSLGNHQYTQFWRDLATKVCADCCQGQRCKEKQGKPKVKLAHGNVCTIEADSNDAQG